jgi:hydrogenase maturation protease
MERCAMRPGEVELPSSGGDAARGALLVIGYGNTLRRDDGVGPRAALSLAARKLPAVIAQAVPQLTPELAEPLAAARLAIFIDARLGGESAEIAIHPLEPANAPALLGHCEDPASLLALAQAAYGTCPPCWLVTIPASDFGLGERLSPAAERGLERALRWILSIADLPVGRISRRRNR